MQLSAAGKAAAQADNAAEASADEASENDPRLALIRSLVELCGSMKLSTIAEMIETEAVAAELKAAGVNLGQGWLFGRAEAEPRTTLSSPGVVRRRGTVEAWG